MPDPTTLVTQLGAEHAAADREPACPACHQRPAPDRGSRRWWAVPRPVILLVGVVAAVIWAAAGGDPVTVTPVGLAMLIFAVAVVDAAVQVRVWVNSLPRVHDPRGGDAALAQLREEADRP